MNKQSTEFDHILSVCLDQLIDGNWTIEDCLANFPEHGETLQELLTLAQHLRQAQAVRPEPDFYRMSRRRLTTRLRPRNPSLWQRLRWWFRARRSSSRRRPRQLDPWRWALAAMAIVVLLLTGGATVLYAASNAALPGDTLYPLDLRFEEVQLRLAGDPGASGSLRLRFSEERLSEAEELAARDDDEHLQVALAAYAVQLQDLAQEVAAGDEPGALPATTTETVGSQLNAHEARLDALYQQLNPAAATAAPEDGFCDPDSDPPPHPAATTLAQQYQLPYEDITSWFCAGHGFGEIMLALTTASANDLSPEDVLALKEETGGWGQVWQALSDGVPPGGMPGRANDDVPATPGPPEDAGPPEDTGPPEGAGPPEDTGPPEDEPPPGVGSPDDPGRRNDPGRPDHPVRPGEAGPPEDAGPPDSAGPPEDAGPPDGTGAPDNAGPPEDAGPPDNAGPPNDAGPPPDADAPDNAGSPEDAGPPGDSGPPRPNSGGGKRESSSGGGATLISDQIEPNIEKQSSAGCSAHI